MLLLALVLIHPTVSNFAYVNAALSFIRHRGCSITGISGVAAVLALAYLTLERVDRETSRHAKTWQAFWKAVHVRQYAGWGRKPSILIGPFGYTGGRGRLPIRQLGPIPSKIGLLEN